MNFNSFSLNIFFQNFPKKTGAIPHKYATVCYDIEASCQQNAAEITMWKSYPCITMATLTWQQRQ